MTYQVDAVVVGAGVIGLAVGRRLAKLGLETVIVESEKTVGQGISSRSSEVIHAGLYYQPGSMKARLCRKGRNQLYEYCQERDIPFRRIGKWVVATSKGQLDKLLEIKKRARENGCCDVRLIDGAEARRLEPELRCEAVLDSPSTGIIDSHSLIMALLDDFIGAAGMLAVCSPVCQGEVKGDRITLTLGDSQRTRLETRYVVNSAGLNAPLVAQACLGFPRDRLPQRSYAKGSYFVLSGRSPFQRLIYPVPDRGGLGVHLTLDMQGYARFGPDVEWVEQPDYNVDPGRLADFGRAITTYWPNCPVEQLQPGYAGIRPKIGTPECFEEDFLIQPPAIHGVNGWVNLFGMESPGLTACLAIADEVLSCLGLGH